MILIEIIDLLFLLNLSTIIQLILNVKNKCNKRIYLLYYSIAYKLFCESYTHRDNDNENMVKYV